MATKEAAVSPAKVPASKQPPENSVWIRYHPWIEGVMAHISAWSIHLLVIGGAVLWFTYLAYALGFAHAPRSLPMEAVRLDIGGGGGNKEGTGTEKGGDHAPLKEGVQADKDNPGEKNNKVDPSDRPQLTEVQAKKIDETFAPDDARYIKQNVGSMQSFANLDKDLRDKLRDGLNPSKGNGGTGTGGGTGSGTGTGTGSGTGSGKQQMLNEREKRFLRWNVNVRPKTRTAAEYLLQLETLGVVLGIPNGPDSIVIIDLSKRPFRPEVKDPSTIKKIFWHVINRTDPLTGRAIENTAAELMAAMGLPGQPNEMIAFIPEEVENDLAKAELAYHHLKEDRILETTFNLNVTGARGHKYDIQVIDQKQK